jgi:hypothetical protein
MRIGRKYEILHQITKFLILYIPVTFHLVSYIFRTALSSNTAILYIIILHT